MSALVRAEAPAAHVAKLYGEPVIEMPHDLYIPPDALEIILEAFEGPLDLLLYLIRKENLDILDIPMAPLTRQYLEYVEIMRKKNLELAAEYLVMAAMLIEIKSRLLLPRPPLAAQVEEDPRAELLRRLLEYERIKKAARALDELPQVGRDVIAISVWIERTVAEQPDCLAVLQLHYLRWVLFPIKGETYFMYQGIFDTDFDKYTEDAVALFGITGLRTVFENLEGFPMDWQTNPAAFVKFVRDHQCPSFLEYAEYPYVSADEIKKALKVKAAFSTMLDQMQ